MKKYNAEKSVQILIALLKAHNVKKVIVSPGNTNITFVGSIQTDPFFEIYSCVDERSAAYMACGLSEESGEPVCISCTGATASRNYMPGLTEAYYRKLPIVAITSSQCNGRIDNLIAQVTDRTVLPNDIVKLSVSLPIVHSNEDFWECENKINKVLIECKREGCGPVHINLQTLYTPDFSVHELPIVNKINRYEFEDEFPEISDKRVAIFIGSHKCFTQSETSVIERFCEKYNSVVFCDNTSGYYGKYKVLYEIASYQASVEKEYPDLIIHLGEISGAYGGMWKSKEIWRVSEDGKVRDPYKLLTAIFDMKEQSFFSKYLERGLFSNNLSYYKKCKEYVEYLRNNIPELPFSNFWVAKVTAPMIPKGSYIHFSILNSLRAWNFFELDSSIKTTSNVGGFGIDGPISTVVGASFANPDKIHYLVVGDLAFFYDMNALGNRHIGNNIRILLINNGEGTQFTMSNSFGKVHLKDDVYPFVAARGHYGNQSNKLVKVYTESLGFAYRNAYNKEQFYDALQWFTSTELNTSMILEVFTYSEDESIATERMLNIDIDPKFVIKDATKDAIKNFLGEKIITKIKNKL